MNAIFFFSSGSARRVLAQLAGDAGSFATDLRFVSESSSSVSVQLADTIVVALLPSSGVVYVFQALSFSLTPTKIQTLTSF